MASLQEKLALSLEALKALQDDKRYVAIKGSDLSRVNRERLLKHGFLKEVLRGWYITTSPDEKEGNSTSWYTSYWLFCARYLNERYGNDYYISADQSLQLHIGNDGIPSQLIIRTEKGSNRPTNLPFKTSLFSMKSPMPSPYEIVLKNGIRLLSLASSLVHCSPSMYKSNHDEIRTALTMVNGVSEILTILLEKGHSTIAGRLAGAFRDVGQARLANEIVETMQSAGYDVREIKPFIDIPSITLSLYQSNPHTTRMELMWASMRDIIVEQFPKPPGLLKNRTEYIKDVDGIFLTDAYHSLSIERYQVSPRLIEKVRKGNWVTKNEY